MYDRRGHNLAPGSRAQRAGPMNGGRRPHRRTPRLLFHPESQRILPRDARGIGTVTDLGVENVDGIPRRHLQADMTVDSVLSGADDVLGRMGFRGRERAALLRTVTVTPPTLDVWVNDDGTLWRETITASIRVDIPALVKVMPLVETMVEVKGVSAYQLDVRASYHPFEIGVPIALKDKVMSPRKYFRRLAAAGNRVRR